MLNVRALMIEFLTALTRRGDAEVAKQPWVGLDPETAFHAGLLAGVALALDLTLAELLRDPVLA